MPEGPEIRLAADEIASVIEGKVIEEIEVGLPSLEPYVEQLTGKVVTEVETRGKALLTHFENHLTIYSHNQLYGVWKTAKRGQYPTTNRQLRLALHTRDKSALLYSASDISVWPREALGEHPLLRKLGPDILNPALTAEQIVDILMSKKFQNRSLASFYLDQGFIAGLGNYLRTEILFAARVHPDVKPSQLSDDTLLRLAQETIRISKRAYNTRGYTVDDELLNSLKAADSDYEGTRFMAFNRESLPCRICVTPIEKGQRGSRRIYWCSNCQPVFEKSK